MLTPRVLRYAGEQPLCFWGFVLFSFLTIPQIPFGLGLAILLIDGVTLTFQGLFALLGSVGRGVGAAVRQLTPQPKPYVAPPPPPPPPKPTRGQVLADLLAEHAAILAQIEASPGEPDFKQALRNAQQEALAKRLEAL